MNKFLVCAALGLVLAATEISAKKSCSSFKGEKCEKKGCDWSKTGDAQFKTCKEFAEDVAAPVVDTPVVQVDAKVCSQYRRGKGCRAAGCVFTRLNGKKSGKRTCNVPETKEPAPAPEEKEVEKKEAESIFAGLWDEKNGCCRDSAAKKIPQGTRFDLTVGANTAEATAECEGACAKTSACTAFELITKTKGKKKKGKKTSYICELHDTLIDSTTRASKSCKRAVCRIKQPATGDGESPNTLVDRQEAICDSRPQRQRREAESESLCECAIGRKRRKEPVSAQLVSDCGVCLGSTQVFAMLGDFKGLKIDGSLDVMARDLTYDLSTTFKRNMDSPVCATTRECDKVIRKRRNAKEVAVCQYDLSPGLTMDFKQKEISDFEKNESD